MKIIFSLVNTGLGNNGGSQTIARMANALWCLGHDVKILSNTGNSCTWEKLQKSIFTKVSTNQTKWPDADIIISTGVHTIPDAISYSKRTGAKHWSWLRGWEKWQMKESDLIGLYSHPNVNLMANGEWLVEYVANRTKKMCRLQYSGIPIEKFKIYPKRVGDPVRIGGLAHFTKSTKKWRTFLNLATRLTVKGIKNIEFTALGDREIGDNNIIRGYTCQPSFEDKIKFYNSVDIWVATSILEGLHIVPMEAGLCGAAIVTPRVIESGTFDYAIHSYTSYMYNPDKIEDLEKWVLHLSMDQEKRDLFSSNLRGLIKNKIGNVTDNAKKLEKILEESL